jgi:DNA-binding Xre family transcriptional regulator
MAVIESIWWDLDDEPDGNVQHIERTMPIKRVQKKIDWTPEDKARHQAIRETFKDKPTLEELVARGELSGNPIPLGTYLNLRLLIGNLRKLREQARLSLSEVSARSGMDKAMLSRLENGHVPNPGIETIARYLDALDKRLEWRVVDVPVGA